MSGPPENRGWRRVGNNQPSQQHHRQDRNSSGSNTPTRQHDGSGGNNNSHNNNNNNNHNHNHRQNQNQHQQNMSSSSSNYTGNAWGADRGGSRSGSANRSGGGGQHHQQQQQQQHGGQYQQQQHGGGQYHQQQQQQQPHQGAGAGRAGPGAAAQADDGGFDAEEAKAFLKKCYLETIASCGGKDPYYKPQGDSVANRVSGVWGNSKHLTHTMPNGQDFFVQLKKQILALEQSKSNDQAKPTEQSKST